MSTFKPFGLHLKRYFVPILRTEGFRGTGLTFRRVSNLRIDIVNVQRSTSQRCYINLASHFMFLPTLSGMSIDLNKLSDSECVFRRRLTGSAGAEQHWDYGDNDAAAAVNATKLILAYREYASDFFSSFEPFPGVFEDLSVEEFMNPNSSKLANIFSFGRGPYGALTLSRIMAYLGKHHRSKEFAEIGLETVDPRATALRAELEQMHADITRHFDQKSHGDPSSGITSQR